MSEVLQYELWRACNCKCTFCTLGKDNLFTPDNLKLQSLQVAINELSSLGPNVHKVIGFIGGEFFQGQLNTPEIKAAFFKLISITNTLLNKNYIENIWLNASLLIGEQPDFYETLKLIDKKNKLWILTSYDTLGRFHTQTMFNTWEKHLFKIKKLYPDININITSILSSDFIKKYLNDELDLKQIRKKYQASLFFKNPVKPYSEGIEISCSDLNKVLGDFFPKRDDMLQFFKKFYKQEGLFEYDKLISTDLRADEIRKNYNDNKRRNLKFIRDRNTLHEDETDLPTLNLKCGHNDIYASYCDSDACILCDKKFIRNLFI